MGIADQGQISKIGQRFLGARFVQVPASHEASEDLCDLQVDQMRRMYRDVGIEYSARNGLRLATLQQKLQQRGCVDDNHRLSRSLRTACAMDSCDFTGAREESLVIISAGVGRLAI